MTTMTEAQPDYLSYLLRLWRSSGEGETVWRVSLVNPHTGERQNFTSLETLFAFLRKETNVLMALNEGGGEESSCN